MTGAFSEPEIMPLLHLENRGQQESQHENDSSMCGHKDGSNL